MTFHKDLLEGDIHVPYNWKYTDSADRLAATGFSGGDVGKLALQDDNKTLWLLTSNSPIIWQGIGTASTSGDYATETLTYTDTTNKVLGPLSGAPSDATKSNLFVINGLPQDYTTDFTLREVTSGSAPGWYVLLSPTSTPPGGGVFGAGLNPATGIAANMVNGDKARLAYSME